MTDKRLKTRVISGIFGRIETAPGGASTPSGGLTQESTEPIGGLAIMLPKTCSIPECTDLQDSRGLCSRHRHKALQSGEIQLLPKTTVSERFWAKVDKTETCWQWTGATKSNGYGNFNVNGKTVMSHRYAWEAIQGPIPQGLMLDHLCFNRKCCNPAHLRAVTMKQNQENRSGARRDSASGILGVHWNKESRGWRASVMQNGKTVTRGPFFTIEEASTAARDLRNELFTHNELDKALS